MDVGDKVLILNLNGKLVAVKPEAPETGKKSLIYNVYGKQVAIGIAEPETGKAALVEQVYGQNLAYTIGAAGPAWFRTGGNNVSSLYQENLKQSGMTVDWTVSLPPGVTGILGGLVTDVDGNIYIPTNLGVLAYSKAGSYLWIYSIAVTEDTIGISLCTTGTDKKIIVSHDYGEVQVSALTQAGAVSWSHTFALDETTNLADAPFVLENSLIFLLQTKHEGEKTIVYDEDYSDTFWMTYTDVVIKQYSLTGSEIWSFAVLDPMNDLLTGEGLTGPESMVWDRIVAKYDPYSSKWWSGPNAYCSNRNELILGMEMQWVFSEDVLHLPVYFGIVPGSDVITLFAYSQGEGL